MVEFQSVEEDVHQSTSLPAFTCVLASRCVAWLEVGAFLVSCRCKDGMFVNRRSLMVEGKRKEKEDQE